MIILNQCKEQDVITITNTERPGLLAIAKTATDGSCALLLDDTGRLLRREVIVGANHSFRAYVAADEWIKRNPV